MSDNKEQKKSMWKWIAGGALLAIGIAAGGYYLSASENEATGINQEKATNGNETVGHEDSYSLDQRNPIAFNGGPLASIDDFNRVLEEQLRDSSNKTFSIPSIFISGYSIGKSDVDSYGKQFVTIFAEAFNKTNKQATISVEGYGCNIGTDEANDRVSLSRANAVKDILMQAGIDESKIEVNGYGKSRNDNFIYPNPEDYRRVIIRIK